MEVMKYELIESPTNPGHWQVEAFTDEGECINAVFSGPGARGYSHYYYWLTQQQSFKEAVQDRWYETLSAEDPEGKPCRDDYAIAESK